MSATTTLFPAIPVFSAADWRDSDTYGIDARAAMTLRQTTISQAELAALARVDGEDMTDADLSVSNVGVVPADTNVPLATGSITVAAGTFYSWKASGGIPGSSYLVTIKLTLASNDVINRTVRINVPAAVG